MNKQFFLEKKIISPFGLLKKPFVLVLGLGKTGLSIAQWCLLYGCRVRIADKCATPPMLNIFKNHLKNISHNIDIKDIFIPGNFQLSLLDDIKLIALSPGLSPLSFDNSKLLIEARLRGIPIWGELEFFEHALKFLALFKTPVYNPLVLAVTGTNGKTTTCSMIAHLIKSSTKYSFVLAGNIGQTLLSYLIKAQKLSNILPDIWIVEVSSFQLYSSQTFKPDIAVILNITQDHIDWHGNFNAYFYSKTKIFSNHTLPVLCRDNLVTNSLIMKYKNTKYITFGSDSPKRAGDFGIAQKAGTNWIVRAETLNNHNYNENLLSYSINYLIPVNRLFLNGKHNLLNIQAALALFMYVDNLPSDSLLSNLCTYVGEPHRIQLISTLKGVDYIDDSKSTNVNSTIAALEAVNRPVWLIIGGDSKGQNFLPLAPLVKTFCRGVFIIGQDSFLINNALSGTGVLLQHFPNLEIAVLTAFNLATTGEVVLLSPACASFGMFKDYVHRAKIFHLAVTQCSFMMKKKYFIRIENL